MNLKECLDVIKKHWNVAPVDVRAISYELGVPIMYANLPHNISGMIQRDDNGYKIVVNSNHATVRQRFTIAHELGHYIYHRDLLGKGVGDTLAYRADQTEMPNPSITILHERQANTFAANLLMPNHLVKELQARGIKMPEELAQTLGVSVDALKIKLGMIRREAIYDSCEEDDDSDNWRPPTFHR